MDPVKPARASGYATDKTQMQADKITLSDILAEMLTFRKEVKQTSKDMSDNIQKYSDWIEDIDKKMEGVAQKLDSVVANIDVLFQENVNLKKTVHELTKKVNTLEQDAKDKVLEINGVPLKNNEDVMELVSKVSEAIGFQFDERKIDNCYRYKPAVPGSNGPAGIHVKFVRKLDMQEFIRKRREKRNLNSRDLGFMDNDASVIYVNEGLTQKRRKLLRDARVARREKNYTYLWVSGGRILMRKDPGSRVVQINSQEDINRLL
ncbi:uncharacterized protein LOC124366740 [Homalodisca vitripennis]|uniref:uncharacterized protein LOC124366740 n=1 Tax=Homalodisca vitripennis TaxID=197043 RepID=UPI001EEA4E8A|nr:uncharacterized protein LOC124366740 [Homalodisca vitripennis]